MCWKTVITRLKNKLPSLHSMTLRLASIYVGTSFILLVFLMFFLYWIFMNQLESENKQFLESTLSVVQNELKGDLRLDDLEMLKEEFIEEPSIYQYYMRLIDANGKVIIETTGMDALVPFSAYHEVPYQTAFKKIVNGKHFLLMHAPHRLNGQTQTIQIAKNISSELKMLVEYRRDLIKILLLGIIVSAAAGVIVTQKGLRPLKEMVKAAKRINITQLNERFDTTACPEELSHLATAFNHMLDRIEEGFDRLSRFSGDLAHELRIPINNLMGNAEVTLSRVRSLEEYQNVIGSNLEELQRLSRLIENLLFLARAENPKAVIPFSPIQVHHMLQELCDYYGVAAEEQNIQLIYHSPENITLAGDLTLLHQAMSNLISNALRYTPAGGSITLSAKTTPHQTVEISVQDTGQGIPAEHIPHLLDRFYRVDADRAQMTGGSGLGLSIVKSIMELHQGELTITSEVGKGTTVTLIFPKMT